MTTREPAGHRSATSLTINEIFHSIQGESRQAGRPCVFIRLTACNLRCVWCDTAYAFDEGSEKNVAEILDAINEWPTKFALITGGEPLVQAGVHDLIAELLDRGYEVAVETGGSIDIAPLDPGVNIIMDLKCPGSGMNDRNLWSNLTHLKPSDEVKFVIADRVDYDWSREAITRRELTTRCGVLMSPVHGVLEPRILAEWVLADGLPVRLQLQIHKYIWSPDMKGV